MRPKNCPTSARNTVRYESERCPTEIGTLSDRNWNQCPTAVGIRNKANRDGPLLHLKRDKGNGTNGFLHMTLLRVR